MGRCKSVTGIRRGVHNTPQIVFQVCSYASHMTKSHTEILLEQERFELKPKSGGGLLNYEVWGYKEKGKSIVTRYALAYVNLVICQQDNGRVLGFDNAHGYHHRHYMGSIEAVEYESYEATQERFQQEWMGIIRQLRKEKR